jgi:CBS-domain-containing membrane protein
MCTEQPALSLSSNQAIRGATLIAVLMAVAHISGVTAMAAPFSATCALLALLPKAPFSQPRTLLVSHAICLAMGAAGSVVPAPMMLLAFAGTWIAIMAMARARALHAPAVAHTVIISLGTQALPRYLTLACGMTACFALYAYLAARTERAVGRTGIPERGA